MRLTQDGGVSKRQASVPAKSCFKAMAKSSSKADCYAQLKNLLPNASQSKTTTEVRKTLKLENFRVSFSVCHKWCPYFISLQLALVEESIAYIAYLESLLRSSDKEVSWICYKCLSIQFSAYKVPSPCLSATELYSSFASLAPSLTFLCSKIKSRLNT